MCIRDSINTQWKLTFTKAISTKAVVKWNNFYTARKLYCFGCTSTVFRNAFQQNASDKNDQQVSLYQYLSLLHQLVCDTYLFSSYISTCTRSSVHIHTFFNSVFFQLVIQQVILYVILFFSFAQRFRIHTLWFRMHTFKFVKFVKPGSRQGLQLLSVKQRWPTCVNPDTSELLRKDPLTKTKVVNGRELKLKFTESHSIN